MTKAIAVAWYVREEWGELRRAASDPDVLEATYDEWLFIATKAVADLKANGVRPEIVEVRVGTLVAWCTKNDRSVDAAARSHFAAELLRRRSVS